jgi:rubrerythrin
MNAEGNVLSWARHSRAGGIGMNKQLGDLEKILEIYAIAQRREQAAYEFYVSAAEKVAEEVEKKLLLDLANFEQQHLKMMKDRYEATLQRIENLKQEGQKG